MSEDCPEVTQVRSAPQPTVRGGGLSPHSQWPDERILQALSTQSPSRDGPCSRDTTLEEVYILRLCRAMMIYGAPAHRLEAYMHLAAEALGLSLQSFYLPGCMIMSFGGSETSQSSSGTRIVRGSPALNISKLGDVHAVHKDIVHGAVTVSDATARLRGIMDQDDKFPRWIRVLMYGLASAFIGPVSYGALPADLPITFFLAIAVGFLELVVVPKSELYGYVFETSAAILVSFLGRAFGSFQWGDGRRFCFSAISQASLVLILPGFIVTNSALELQSGYIVTGAVRMVYGIIYTLFLAFGFTVGIVIYGAIDSNAVSSTKCDDTWPFWWQVAFVVPFTFCYIIVQQGKWRNIPPMLLITLAGWLVNHFSAQRFPTVPSISQALGSLTVGVLANLYSRLAHSKMTRGPAVALMYPAIFIQVPGSLAASGSLVSAISTVEQIINHNGNGTRVSGGSVGSGTGAALNAGYAMVEIAIGITVGLSVGTLLIYPFRKKSGKSGVFSF